MEEFTYEENDSDLSFEEVKMKSHPSGMEYSTLGGKSGDVVDLSIKAMGRMLGSQNSTDPSQTFW